MFLKIKKELTDFSVWFKWAFCILFFIYIACWFFTIYISVFQVKNNITPVLPVMPKDSEEYRDLTESIIQNHNFYYDGKISTVRAPGYPFFVAVIKTLGRSYFAVTLIQILLVFLSAIIIRRLGTLFLSKKAGELASLLFLINPVVLVLSLAILTDVLFLSAFIFGFYLAVSITETSRWKILSVSVLFATAIYTRPMGVFALPIFIAPLLISQMSIKKKIQSILIMIGVIIIFMAPWIYRNHINTGVADFTSFKSINLVGYAVPSFLAYLNSTTEEQEKINIENKLGITRDKWRDLQYAKKISAEMEKIILEHPLSYIRFHIISSLPFLFSSSIQYIVESYQSVLHIKSEFTPGVISYLTSGNWEMFFQGICKTWWKMLERIIWSLVYLVALVGFWQNRRRLISWAFIFVPLYLMILAGSSANIRYAVQALPFILLLFSIGLIQILEKIKNKYV